MIQIDRSIVIYSKLTRSSYNHQVANLRFVSILIKINTKYNTIYQLYIIKIIYTTPQFLILNLISYTHLLWSRCFGIHVSNSHQYKLQIKFRNSANFYNYIFILLQNNIITLGIVLPIIIQPHPHINQTLSSQHIIKRSHNYY